MGPPDRILHHRWRRLRRRLRLARDGVDAFDDADVPADADGPLAAPESRLCREYHPQWWWWRRAGRAGATTAPAARPALRVYSGSSDGHGSAGESVEPGPFHAPPANENRAAAAVAGATTTHQSQHRQKGPKKRSLSQARRRGANASADSEGDSDATDKQSSPQGKGRAYSKAKRQWTAAIIYRRRDGDDESSA
jgi:hypothetical protein